MKVVIIASAMIVASVCVVVTTAATTQIISATPSSTSVPTTSFDTQDTDTSRADGVIMPALVQRWDRLVASIHRGMDAFFPVVALFGAMMAAALRLGLLRQVRREDQRFAKSLSEFSIDTPGLVEGLSDVFQKVNKALNNMDRKYQ